MRPERPADASAEYFRTLLENATDLIAVLGPDGSIHYISESAVRLLGRRPETLIGTNAFDLIHPDDRPDVLEAIRAGIERRDTGLPMTFKVRHRDGSWRHLEATDRNLLDQPSIAGIVINGRDVTERVQAEEALRDDDRRKDEFLAMLAHELRNPLAPIRSAAEVLRLRGEDAGRVAWAADVIERQVKHLARLVDDLLDVSRITRGTLAVEREPLDLGQVVRRAVEMVRPLVDAAKHELTVALPDASVPLEGDVVRLPQVVANLLANAAKFTPAGGHVNLVLERADTNAVLTVRDDGIGIAAEQLGRIFEPFVQGDSSLARSRGGLGVGLTLVRRLVELHGGRVEASSAGPGHGSEFVVRLPLHPAAIGAAPARAAVAPARACRILVVDDNVDAAESLAAVLATMGHAVTTASDGRAAIDAVSRTSPDLILLDIGLPGLDGYEVARRLRAWLGRAPMLVALTGYGQEEDRLRSREAGFDHHVVKPVDERALGPLIAECIMRR